MPYRKELLIHTCWVKQLICRAPHGSLGNSVMHGENCVNCPWCLTTKCLVFTYKLVSKCCYIKEVFVFIYKSLQIHIPYFTGSTTTQTIPFYSDIFIYNIKDIFMILLFLTEYVLYNLCKFIHSISIYWPPTLGQALL